MAAVRFTIGQSERIRFNLSLSMGIETRVNLLNSA